MTMIEHLWHCAILFLYDPLKMLIATASVAGAAAMLLLAGNASSLKLKIFSIYAHLSLAIFPIIFFALTMHCGADCNTPLTNMVLYSLPITMGLAAFAGFVAIPALLLYTGHEIKSGFAVDFIGRQSRKMRIKPPKIYLSATGKAAAFSFKSVFSAIFVSGELLRLLNRKELEAVLLHELAHISSKSSIFKLSAFLMRLSPFSIFSPFGNDLTADEKKADGFAIKTQKTGKYLLSAKRKIEKSG